MPFIRSVLHMLWMMATVVPFAIAILGASIFIRGNPLWAMARAWLR
ncbi:MAG: 1-acyl-sn-glycerol-3-phosphate acyltransferase, partial [Rhodoferax sp.]|nr:1-acyl-sn-glycerol-3-phosphate acyltransferase [Rhodoferax sp.]